MTIGGLSIVLHSFPEEGSHLLEPFFRANQIIFHFADGLVFFLLGFVALLAAHAFRTSRLAVARALPWLAAFGMLVGTAKWGVVFVPLQAAYLPDRVIDWLHHLQALLLVAGHGSLLVFGLHLRPLPRWVTAGRLAWGLLLLVAGLALWGTIGFHAAARAVAAYLLGLPGAILSGYGLMLQGRQLDPFYPRPARALRLSAWAFVLSVPVGPLAIPLDGGQSARLMGIPVEVGLIGGGLFLALTLFSGLEALREENLRRTERAERREAVLEERYRLGKELNDGLLQELVAVGMLIGALEPDLPEGSRAQTSLVKRYLQGAVDQLRTYLMDLTPMDWNEPDLYAGLRLLIAEFQANSLLPVRLNLNPGLAPEPGVSSQVYLVAHEALTNIRRHAGPCEVEVTLEQKGASWTLTVEDDGAGFPVAQRPGPGIERMTRTADHLGGSLEITAAPGSGTRVRLTLPLSANGIMGPAANT